MIGGETPRSTLATVEGLGKAAVAVPGVIYALGLAVVTLHLASYGASGLGLLQEQYVLAGMWALLPLGATGFAFAVIVAAALEEFGEMKVDPASTKRQRWLVIARKIRQAAFVSVAWFIIAAFFLGFVTPQVYRSGIASIGWWTLLGYLGYFAASVYPLIPAAVGGGQPRRVHVLLKSDRSGASAAALLQGTPPSAALPEHRLLFATDKSYIVVDPSDPHRAIEIPKDLVTAVRTVGR